MKTFKEFINEAKKFKIGDQVKPLAKLKRKQSVWVRDFANKFYTIKDFDKMDDGEEVLVLSTGPEDYDYSLVYPDEVIGK